jgi:sRNA-binding regulator protein Hfq
MVNRRLFRPSITEMKEAPGPRQHHTPPAQAHKKPTPPEQTHAESFYWVKQMQARTSMTVVLDDGETLHGVVEWYDRDCIKLTRFGSPNLLIYKQYIKYCFKEGEDAASGGTNGNAPH